jgi:hypothetical protein
MEATETCEVCTLVEGLNGQIDSLGNGFGELGVALDLPD